MLKSAEEKTKKIYKCKGIKKCTSQTCTNLEKVKCSLDEYHWLKTDGFWHKGTDSNDNLIIW